MGRNSPEDSDINPSSEASSGLKRLVLEKLDASGITPNEKLGQHFLLDQGVINVLTEPVSPNDIVIEIGAGVGQLTEALAEKEAQVVSVEVDRRYEPVLSQIADNHPNVRIVFGDALALDFRQLLPKDVDPEGILVIASLPYHITEPFLHKLAHFPCREARLLVGRRLVYALQALESQANFGQLSLVGQTFFHLEVLDQVDREVFYPVPRAKSAIISLIPREESEFTTNQARLLLRGLLTPGRKSPLVKNVLKEGLTAYAQVINQNGLLSKKGKRRKERREVKRYLKGIAQKRVQGESREKPFLTQNKARAKINALGLSERILNNPFRRLNNSELEILSRALKKLI